MGKRVVLAFLMLFASSTFCIQQPNKYRDFLLKASSLPTFRDLYIQGKISIYTEPGSLIDANEYKLYKVITCNEYESILDEFFSIMSAQLNKRETWLGSTAQLEHLINPESDTFVPYAQRVVLTPGSHFICKGDLHGDLHSLLAFIKNLQESEIIDKENPLKIVDPTYTFFFHGDYVDRGLWGVEVMYLLMLLKIQNPQQVFLIRGNHEDPAIALQYGFAREFHAKFNQETDETTVARCYHKISKFYNCLPLVCYVGSGKEEARNFVQLCHGGIELGYNSENLLASSDEKAFHFIPTFERYTQCCSLRPHEVLMPSFEKIPLKSLCQNFAALTPTHPYPIGFLWHDFVVDSQSLSFYKPGRGLRCNKDLTHDYLNAASTDNVKLFGIIRAHQHMPDNNDPMMSLLFKSHGCAALWQQTESHDIVIQQGMVLTLLLSPDSLHGTPHLGGLPYTGFDYDTYAVVTTGESLSQWNIKVVNNDIYRPQTATAA